MQIRLFGVSMGVTVPTCKEGALAFRAEKRAEPPLDFCISCVFVSVERSFIFDSVVLAGNSVTQVFS
jgi:hypothetical protein